ncbi:MAG: DUF6391 domain-containing protein, partial [Anaerolineaceae bacterium]|nr:DUF6391 domain-containing protein [Anaerolineaceae bacterium]
IRSTRRNHALEHATMKVLAERFKGLKMMGHSNPGGFLLFADLPTELVTDAVLEARKRLQAGESQLAIHPGCGTNIAASSLLAGSASSIFLMALSRGKTPKWWQILISTIIAVPVYILSKPLGPRLQEMITTDAEISDLDVKLVTSQKTRNGFFHQINTRA